MVNGEIQDNEYKKVFLVEGFQYKISMYYMYEPLINLCFS